MNNDNSSLNDNLDYLNHLDYNNDNEIKKSDIDDEKESKTYNEYGAHFRYKDLFKKLLKIKKEREEKEANKKKIINNNIIINNNMNFNLFNNRKRGVSRNIQINEYLKSYNKYDDISKTFISYIISNQYKSVILPSIENIQKKISNYLNILEMDKIKNINKQNNKLNKIYSKNIGKTAKLSKNKKNKNIKDKFIIKINSINKEKRSALNTKISKKIKSPDKNAINLKKSKYIMNTLSCKNNINKNINIYIFKRINFIFKHRKKGNWTKQITKQVTKSKSRSKSKTNSKTNSKNKKRRTIFRNGNKIYNNLKQFTKYTDKTTTINLRYKNNNYFCDKKYINQNYTTKIINNKKRKNDFLNFSNSEKQRKAHSSSTGKSQKYDLDSLIHNNSLYSMMHERKIKSPSNIIKQNYKQNFLNKQVHNIITLNNNVKNYYKIKTKNQLLKNSMNLNSLGVSIIKKRDSKENMKSENNISKSNSKIKNSNLNIRSYNNINPKSNNIINIKSSQVKRLKSINDFTLNQSNRITLKKLKTVSPLKITFIFKNTNNNENSKIYNNKKRRIYIQNKVAKNKLVNNKSLDSQKIFFKRKKIKEISNNSKNMKSKSKNKIISRNIGVTIANNNMASNYTNNKINSKDIFNFKLNNLTIANLNKMKQNLSRNITNNLSSFFGKKKKSKLINNTNSYINGNINLFKNKGPLSINNNNSNLIKKDNFIKGSKSKKRIYLANNLPNRKNIKKNVKFLD